jgi:hypothetical protein
MEDFFEILEKETGLRQVSNRPYGHLKFSPHSVIVVRVKKKSVSVAFNTDGKPKSLPPEDHIKWANESGILRKEIDTDGYFQLQRGQKDQNKSSVVYEFALPDSDLLSDPAFQSQIVGAVEELKDALDGFVSAKPDVKQVQSGLDADIESSADEDPFERVAESLKGILDDIIETGRDEFIESHSFKVRPGVAYDKFYLDHVSGSYDCSLQGLIHHLMWERKFYHELLPDSQISVVARIVEEEPESIYSPDLEDESMEPEDIDDLDSDISYLFAEVIGHVGSRLQEFDFFDPSDFEEEGYLDED